MRVRARARARVALLPPPPALGLDLSLDLGLGVAEVPGDRRVLGRHHVDDVGVLAQPQAELPVLG